MYAVQMSSLIKISSMQYVEDYYPGMSLSLQMLIKQTPLCCKIIKSWWDLERVEFVAVLPGTLASQKALTTQMKVLNGFFDACKTMFLTKSEHVLEYAESLSSSPEKFVFTTPK